MVARPRKPVLTGKNAAYAAAAAVAADTIVSIFRPDYTGLFQALAALLTGGG